MKKAGFQLFDPLVKFLPAFAKTRVLTGQKLADAREENLIRPILIRDLFTHTAGFTYGFFEESHVSELYRQARGLGDPDRSLEAVIGELARLPLAYQPGTKWHYSMSIDVIGHLIEVISGKPLQQFLQERLFEPLSMTDTAFFVPAEKQHRLATMYGHMDILGGTMSAMMQAWQTTSNQRLDLQSTHPSTNTRNFARGGYGLFSTAADYLRFTQMLLNRGVLEDVRILSPKTADLMHTNHLPASLLPLAIGPIVVPGFGFGLGSRVLLNVAESLGLGSVGEFGWAGAAKTYYWVDPQEGIIGIMMSQYLSCFDLPEKDFQVLAYQAMVD
jgi:CubicO group peptidase (beta-lactamase class C family)